LVFVRSDSHFDCRLDWLELNVEEMELPSWSCAMASLQSVEFFRLEFVG
jgi:hypothetical protein